MDVLEIREFCLKMPFVTEDFPFDEDILVFKVMGKMFLLVNLGSFPLKISLKVKPEEAISLLESYSFVLPGYHLNKKYWISLLISDYTPVNLVKRLIKVSYNEVVRKLPKYKQEIIIKEIDEDRG